MSLVKLFVSVMAVLMAMILACGSNPVPNDPDLTDNPIPLDQNIVFEVEYENHAWGFSYHGWFVTDSGEIWSYSYSEDEEPWDTRLNFPLTLELLREKYNHNPVYVGNVDLSILAEKIELIPPYDFYGYYEVAVCADFGSIRFYAYIQHPDRGGYRQLLLRQLGDLARKNTVPETEQLFLWLWELNGGIGEIPCDYPA